MKFQCDICDIKFTAKRNLKRHITKVHEEKKSFECPLCLERFSRKGAMKIHIDKKHGAT